MKQPLPEDLQDIWGTYPYRKCMGLNRREVACHVGQSSRICGPGSRRCVVCNGGANGEQHSPEHDASWPVEAFLLDINCSIETQARLLCGTFGAEVLRDKGLRDRRVRNQSRDHPLHEPKRTRTLSFTMRRASSI